MKTNNAPDYQEKTKLRQEARRLARQLIDNDEVEKGAEVLESYRRRFKNLKDGYCKWGLALLFLIDLAENCKPVQRREVGYLIDEHSPSCSSFFMDILRRHELRMYQRSRDVQGVKKCMILLGDRLNGAVFWRSPKNRGQR